MMKFQDNRGFTLIEVIMSIAILSIVSAVVLQLFVSSKGLNNRSRAIDIAGVYASNAIERTKALSRYELNIIESKQQEYYDVNWNILENKDESKYVLTLRVEEDDEVSDGFYRIQSSVTEVGNIKPLVEYNTSYYTHVKE